LQALLATQMYATQAMLTTTSDKQKNEARQPLYKFRARSMIRLAEVL